MTIKEDEFVGLDEQILGDGTSDDKTRPLSEFVERQVETNSRYLKTRDWKVCYNPYQPHKFNDQKTGNLSSNSRRLSHAFSEYGLFIEDNNLMYPGFLFSLPVYVFPDTDFFRVTIRGDVASAQDETASKIGGSTGSLNDLSRIVRVKLYLIPSHIPTAPQQLGEIYNEKTYNLDPSDNPVHRMTIGPNDKKPQGQEPASLMIAIHTNWEGNAVSTDQGAITTNADAVKHSKFRVLSLKKQSGSGSLDATTANTFLRNLSEDQIIEWRDSRVYGTQFKIGYSSQTDKLIGTSRTDVPFALVPTTVSRRAINSITPKSWVFECFSDKSNRGPNQDLITSAGYNHRPYDSMRANRTINGKSANQTAKNIDYNYKKPRLKAIGPKGGHGATSDVERSWARPGEAEGHKHRRWRWTPVNDANLSTASSDARFDNLTLRIDKGSATLRVITTYAVISHWGIVAPKNNQSNLVDAGAFGEIIPDAPNLEDLLMEANAQLDFSYQLKQYGSTATNNVISSKTEPETAQRVYKANMSNKFPLLRTVFDAFLTGNDGTDNFNDFNMTDRNTNWNHTMREGVFEATDASGIIQRVEHTISVPSPSDSTIDHKRPVQLISYLSNAKNFDATYEGADGVVQNHDLTKVAFVNLGSTVWEVPA